MAALSVLLCFACAKIEKPSNEGWTELGGDRPVLFNSSLATLATKSYLEEHTSFGVFAFYQPGSEYSPGAWNNSRTPDFMFNQAVTYNGNSSYTYTPIRYWPSNSYNTLTFWAYYPYDHPNDNIQFVESGSTNTQYTSTSTGYPDIKYTVNTGTTDLLVAAPVTNQSKPANDAPVSFTFHHTLSEINFQVKKTSDNPIYTVTLDAIGFKWIYKNGIHSSVSNVHATTPWSNLGGAENTILYAYNPETGMEVTGTTEIDVPNSTVMLIPQNLETNGAILYVEYSVSLSGGNPQTYQENIILDRNPETSNNDLWEECISYTYILSITPGQPIMFTVSCDTWGDVYHWHL